VRTFAVWESVRALVERRTGELGRPLRVVDIGGGTGGLAVRVGLLGHRVTVVDPSPDALAALNRRAGDAGVADRVVAVQGDAGTLLDVHPAGEADLVCCHGVLEFVDDPQASLQSVAAVLADGGHLSLLVAQRLAVVMAKALAGQFAQARHALTSADGRWGATDPLPRRFDAGGVEELLRGAGMEVQDSHGVRIFSDLVPAAFTDSDADRAALLELEQAAARHPDFGFLGQLGATLHVLARKA
jgi:SAM-dependent methyltransferase